MSDGEYHISTLMPSKAISDALIESDGVIKNSVVRVQEYALKEVLDKKDPSKNTRLVLATRIDVIQRDVPERIGNPADISKDAGANKRRQANAQLAGSSSGGGGGGGGSNVLSGAVAKKSRDTGEFDPIASLNPYRNRWQIKARVTKRGDKKTWSNARGEGSLFSVDLLDAHGSEIRATFWKEAVDKFYDVRMG